MLKCIAARQGIKRLGVHSLWSHDVLLRCGLVGLESPLNALVRRNERLFYALDAIPISLAMVAWNVAHPGTILIHPDSEFSSDN